MALQSQSDQNLPTWWLSQDLHRPNRLSVHKYRPSPPSCTCQPSSEGATCLNSNLKNCQGKWRGPTGPTHQGCLHTAPEYPHALGWNNKLEWQISKPFYIGAFQVKESFSGICWTRARPCANWFYYTSLLLVFKNMFIKTMCWWLLLAHIIPESPITS